MIEGRVAVILSANLGWGLMLAGLDWLFAHRGGEPFGRISPAIVVGGCY